MKIFVAVLALAGAIGAACAQEHKHGDQVITGATGKFYETWMRPDNRAISCCNQFDCYATEARFRNGRWYARQRETGDWVVIPPEKIEHDRDGPDSLNHVCMSKTGHVFCFKIGAGG